MEEMKEVVTRPGRKLTGFLTGKGFLDFAPLRLGMTKKQCLLAHVQR